MLLVQIEGFMLLNSHGSDCMWLCGMLTLCIIQYIGLSVGLLPVVVHCLHAYS